jgi:hypothetical protein
VSSAGRGMYPFEQADQMLPFHHASR